MSRVIDGGWFIMLLAWRTGFLYLLWYFMDEILKCLFGIDELRKLNRQKSWWQRLFHIGYSNHLCKYRGVFNIFKYQFILSIIAMFIYIPLNIGHMQKVSVGCMIVEGVLFVINMLIILCTDIPENSCYKDERGEYNDVAQARVVLSETREDQQKYVPKQNAYDPPRKRAKAIFLEEKGCHRLERNMYKYYAFYLDLEEEKLQQRDDDILRLRKMYSELEQRLEAEGITEYDILEKCRFFSTTKYFWRNYLADREKMLCSVGRKKRKRLEDMWATVLLFEEDISQRYVNCRNIGLENRAEFDEAVDAVLQATDEIEAWQEKIPDADLYCEIIEMYDRMDVNGLLPEERQERFLQYMHPGEQHLIYDYDDRVF